MFGKNIVNVLMNGTSIQDGLISPTGGLVIMGEKGSYFADKDDSALISPKAFQSHLEAGAEYEGTCQPYALD